MARIWLSVMVLVGAIGIGLSAAKPARAEGSGVWLALTPENPPPPRHDHIFVSGAEGRAVLFGGRAAGGIFGDTWLYDAAANTWRILPAAPAPAPRFGSAAAFDAKRGRVLLFAGEGASRDFFNDVWAFDFISETWSRLEVKGTPPIARYGTSAVVDAANDALIISHGFAQGRFDDTFVLDLATNTWQDRSPTVRPLKRCLHEAVYDEASGQMILFGGCSSGHGPCPQGDTWRYDALTNTWYEVTPTNAAPAPRSNPSLVAGDGVVWLFGGRGGSGDYFADLWAFDPLTGEWLMYRSENAPPLRSSHDATWDAAHGQMILFGGVNKSGDLNDLWVYRPPSLA